MEWIQVLLRRFASLFQRRELDARLDEELSAHIDLAIAENVRRGMAEGEARTAALREFGGVTQTRERYRLQRGVPWIEQIWRDARFAVRQLRKSPGFALTAIFTLMLGIGAATSVFSVVNGVLLKPFAFREPNRVVVMREAEDVAGKGRVIIPFNYRHFQRLRQNTKSLEDAAIFTNRAISLSPDGDHPYRVGGLAASPNLLRMLGVAPILGRDFAESDAVKGAAPVAILSYGMWQTLFQGNSHVIGQTLRLSGEPATIVGVLGPGMHFPQFALAPKIEFLQVAGARETQIYVPLIPDEYALKDDTGDYNYKAIARLKPGASIEQASAELETMQKSYSASAHLPIAMGIAMTPLAKDVASGISGALWMLFAAVGTVLLIACVNLANLQLARAANAEHETAVRAALGASKGRLVMARLMESLVLACVGGAMGVALAFAGVRLLLTLVPANVPRLEEVHVSLPVLLFALGLSVVSAVAFGMLPALKSLDVHPQAAMQANSTRTGSMQKGGGARNGMVAAQVACTLVLLIVTLLTLRSFSRLMRMDRGFDSSHITTAQVDLLAPKYDDTKPGYKQAKLAYTDRALAALSQLPGVQSVAMTSSTPMTGETWVNYLERPDHPLPMTQLPLVNVRWINAEYMTTMRIPLVAGRNLTASDRANPLVALISEKTAREAFPGENPIGRTISNIVPDADRPVTVIGVVADAHINGLKDDAAMLYAPYWAFTPWTVSFLVRSSQPGNALIPEMRSALWQIDPQVTIPVLKSLDDQVGDSVATERFQTIVLSCFGVAALLLALLGVYGVLAYSVSLRQQEFGIRIALGSGKGTLVGLVLRQAAYPVLLGAGIGLMIALVATHWIQSVLYETPAMDPIAIGGSILLLLAAAAVAAVVPARRAASVDPMRTLRME
jgi:predicted permease